MDALKEWVRGLVALTVFAEAVDMVLPLGDLKKYARLALGLLIVLKVASPLAGLAQAGAWQAETTGALAALRQAERAAAPPYDEKTRTVIEWQCEQLVRAIPGVETASVSASMRQPDDWPMPLGAAAIKRLDIRVTASPHAQGGGVQVREVEPVRPLAPRGRDSPGAEERAAGSRADDLADTVRSVVCEKFGLAEDAVHVEVGAWAGRLRAGW